MKFCMGGIKQCSDQITSRGPIQPQPVCDSMKLQTCNPIDV